MPVSSDIVATWRRPRAVVRRLLSMGRREDRALMFLMAACGLIFVAQWPPLRRAAFEDPSIPFDARIGGALLAWLLWMPLIAYAIAALTHLVARVFGGRGTWYSARLAFFWSLLASTPAWLFHGLVAGFIGPGPAEILAGALVLFSVLGIWGLALWEAERAPEAAT
ncbi:YIP1 family protein [Rhodobacterales bacterium HKCCE2091]|nr:YIP1 family protein [Rhodobacterales bacterium HKCCE2091]